MLKGKIYNASDIFIMRTPLFSLDMYSDIFFDEDKLINIVNNNEIIKEAILVSSIPLYNELGKKFEGENCKKKEKTLSSLVKYLVRMTTRTTPYGLFAGVDVGNFSEYTKIDIMSNTNNLKRTRVDMDWILAVIKKLEEESNVLENLYLKYNKLAFQNGDRLEICYMSNCGQLNKENNLGNLNATIRYTNQVKKVIEITNKPITYNELFKVLKNNNTAVPEEKIKFFLNELVRNEYLLSELKPQLESTNIFVNLINKLSCIASKEELYNDLVDIQILINEYNKMKIGDGIDKYLEIVSKMEKIHKCKNYLQVDMLTNTKDIKLDNIIKLEVERLSEFLLELSSNQSKYKFLQEYLNEFVETYGEYREISVLELLHEGKGLGAPVGYTKPISRKVRKYDITDSGENKFETFLINKVLKSINDSKNEVEIFYDELSEYRVEHNENEIPKSIELFTHISKVKTNGVEDFKLHLSPIWGSNSYGKSFGRFIDMTPETTREYLLNIEKEQDSLYDNDIIIASINELPQNGRLSNVSLNINTRKYELAISTNNSKEKRSLSIDDMYVGIEIKNNKRKFYIKSKTLNKKIIFKPNNMLNYRQCSNVYRLLLEISMMEEKNITSILYTIFYNTFKNFEFVPRVVYSKSVLYPATWKLSSKILGIDIKNCSRNEFYNAIKLWIEDRKVPNYVYLKESDNRLLLNLRNILHLNEIYNLIKNKNNILIMTEIEEQYIENICKSKQEIYCREFVFPVFKNKFFNEKHIVSSRKQILTTKSNYTRRRSQISSIHSERIYLPGDEWLSVKIYTSVSRVEELIKTYVIPFCESIVNTGDAKMFFFLRYADPQFHIRLRIKGTKENIQHKVIPKTNVLLEKLLENGLLNDTTIDSYRREVERYGGPDLIELAEKIFYDDSIFIFNLLNLEGMSFEVALSVSIINIMTELGLKYKEQKEMLCTMYNKNYKRELFQNNRRELLNICDSYNEWENLRKSESGYNLYQLFQIRKENLNKFSFKMSNLDNRDELWNDKESIIYSIIHMHCNRALGDRNNERTIMGTVRHILYSLEYKKNKQLENI